VGAPRSRSLPTSISCVSHTQIRNLTYAVEADGWTAGSGPLAAPPVRRAIRLHHIRETITPTSFARRRCSSTTPSTDFVSAPSCQTPTRHCPPPPEPLSKHRASLFVFLTARHPAHEQRLGTGSSPPRSSTARSLVASVPGLAPSDPHPDLTLHDRPQARSRLPRHPSSMPGHHLCGLLACQAEQIHAFFIYRGRVYPGKMTIQGIC